MQQAGAAPTSFDNPSPFTKKAQKKDPLGSSVMALGIIALVACILVMLLSFTMSAG